jgi:hypothetical protein
MSRSVSERTGYFSQNARKTSAVPSKQNQFLETNPLTPGRYRRVETAKRDEEWSKFEIIPA